MTRAEALHKLLHLGPLTEDQARQITGWHPEQFNDALACARLANLVHLKNQTNQHCTLLASRLVPAGWSFNT